jgi:glycosyltransferase involved in cell wall biosynthesis
VPDAHLEIVGEPRGYPPVDLRQSFSRDLHGRVTMRSYVDDETLDSLYRTASIFAFPSAYEGFGFTPLEALSAGVPPVVLDTAVAVEIYGAAARYVPNVPPLDTRLGEALVQLLTSATARSELLDHAPDVLARYRWDRTAAETLRAIEEAGRG